MAEWLSDKINEYFFIIIVNDSDYDDYDKSFSIMKDPSLWKILHYEGREFIQAD